MHESNDEMVQATLHALAELVPLLGAEAVMGTTRRNSFTDAKPRVSCETLLLLFASLVSRLSRFSYCKRQKLGGGLGTRQRFDA